LQALQAPALEMISQAQEQAPGLLSLVLLWPALALTLPAPALV